MNTAKKAKQPDAAPQMKKPYTLRPLTDEDLWPVLEILGKVFPEELSGMLGKLALEGRGMEEIGAEGLVRLAAAALKNVGSVRSEVYALLSSLSGIPAEEIPKMEFGTTPGMLRDMVEDAKNRSFFKEFAGFF